jgi:hypothetical protein
MSDQTADMLEAIQRPQIARLQAEVEHLRAQLQIATDALGTIADCGGPAWDIADRALARMQEVE